MKNKPQRSNGIVTILIIVLAIIVGIYYFYSAQQYRADVPEANALSNGEAIGLIKSAYSKGESSYIDINYIGLRHQKGDMPLGTIVDDSPNIATLKVSSNVSIKLSNKMIDGVLTSGNYIIGFNEFKEIFKSPPSVDFRADNPWNIVVKDGIVIEIRENFRS